MTRASLGLVIWLSSVPGLAADWQIAPRVRVATMYADNPRLLPGGGVSSVGATGELSAAMRRLTERSELSIAPRLRSNRYRGDETLDSDDTLLDAEFRYFSERSEWNASMNLTRDTTLTSELGSTGFVESNRPRERVAVSGGPTYRVSERLNVGMQVQWSDIHYVDADFTGLVDYEYRALSAFTGFSASERSSFNLTVQGGELLVPDFDVRTRDATLRLGWTYKPHALWAVKLSAGPSYVDAPLGSDDGAVFDAEVTWQAERWNLSTYAGRDLTPTGRGVLTRRDRAILGLNRYLAERLSGGISAQWIRNQDLVSRAGASVFREIEYGYIDINVNWRFAEHWNLILGASGATQRYEAIRGGAEDYRTTLSIVWNGQPRPL